MVAAHSPSIDVRRLICEPLQRLCIRIGVQLINRLGLGSFLKCQRQLVNELSKVFEPPDPLAQCSMMKPPPANQCLCLMEDLLIEQFQQNDELKSISQNLLLFDLHPQPPTSRKDRL